jgi:type 2 lantibiotic biosynthesis protein LanM
MMDKFYQRLIIRGATIDEVLSDEFEPLPGQKTNADSAARRLAAWCRSCASGDWSLFEQRLNRDALSFGPVLARFATIRRDSAVPWPIWVNDAIWIEQALQSATDVEIEPDGNEACPFEHLFLPLVRKAEASIYSERATPGTLNQSARASLRFSLLRQLSAICAPALYELFVKLRKANKKISDASAPQCGSTLLYDGFVAEMKAVGFRKLFENKPVLLRLIATITRQWIDSSRELIARLHADIDSVRRELLPACDNHTIVKVESDVADPHNGGRSVQVVSFLDGSQILYKPKDLRVDVAWQNLIERLNRATAPVQLRAVRAIARDGYGWTEFIRHSGCTNQKDCREFFRRAGAWLALFHCFAAADMHQENIIAAGDHPVPIDLETIFHTTIEDHEAADPAAEAAEAAKQKLANSVMMVGLLPAYGRSPENKIFAVGGMTADWSVNTKITWLHINTDEMCPTRTKQIDASNTNLPHVDGVYAKFADHIDDFITGFETYARFLLSYIEREKQESLLEGFAGSSVRKVVRPTRFYHMLLQRLKNHQTMDDGVAWSSQADFMARLADWETDTDSLWPLQRAERSALISLNVPHFVSASDTNEIRDATGFFLSTRAPAGLDCARARLHDFSEQEIGWQIEVIKQNTSSLSRSDGPKTQTAILSVDPNTPIVTKEDCIAEANRIAKELADYAFRRGTGAAWISLDWLGDADVFQLVCLGPDLYNGNSGIGAFLAAHAGVTGCSSSGELALAAIAQLRNNLKSRNAAHIARSLGIGAGTGLGSIVYALTIISKFLQKRDLLVDAHAVAELFTDDLIAADKQLDVIGGCAGAVLCLLRLYRDGNSEYVLNRAIKCGEHLLNQNRVGVQGRRSWSTQTFGQQALNGMSHGAAGFSYALASLAAVTGQERFSHAALECITFENSNYEEGRHNWPDMRAGGEPSWTCQWCHGAPGIGLARVATARRGQMDAGLMASDIQNAVEGTTNGWPGLVDTLCCGTLGSIEFLREASVTLGRGDLKELASRRLSAVLQNAKSAGDYRWNSGNKRFNLGLFRGLAGVGYACLRQVDESLPNILIWD